MKIDRRFLCAGAVLAVMLTAGCSQSNPTSNTVKKRRIAFVTNNASDFWMIARRGTEKADAELENAEVEFRIPSDGTAAEQRRIVDDLITKGVAGFAISPVDPAN